MGTGSDRVIEEHNEQMELGKAVKEMEQMVKEFKKAAQEREKSYQRRDQSIINLMWSWQKELSWLLSVKLPPMMSYPNPVPVDIAAVADQVTKVRDNIRKLLRVLDYKGTF